MPTRRDVLAQLAALAAVAAAPRSGWSFGVTPSNPLDGTIADYAAGLRRGAWTAAEITEQALERCRTDGARLRAIDVLSRSALADARTAGARQASCAARSTACLSSRSRFTT